MKALLVLAIVLSLSLGQAWAQCSVTIGDGVTLPVIPLEHFLEYLGSGDTICIAPGVYHLSAADGWPLTIPVDAPRVVGADGAETTILVGDGEMTAFLLADNALGRFSGLTFREFGKPIDAAVLGADTSLEFTDNIVENCERGLRIGQHYAIVSRNIFRDNVQYGVSCSGVYPTIEDNEISYNGYGISVIYLNVFTGNHVHHNTDFGLHSMLNTGVIDYNIFEHNGGAGLLLGSAGASEVSHNIFRSNAAGIEYYLTGSTRSAFFRSNDLYGNTSYDFKCVAPGSPHTLDATLNWWGTTDPTEIANHIYDNSDDPGIAYIVAFDPWCEEPGCDGGVPVNRSHWGSIKALYR